MFLVNSWKSLIAACLLVWYGSNGALAESTTTEDLEDLYLSRPDPQLLKYEGTTTENLENLLLSTPDPQLLKSALRDITQRSHVAGTKGDWENAFYVRDKLRGYGFEADIQPVEVMMTYPLERPKLSTSFGFHAKMSEDIVEEDVTSSTTEWRNHTFLAYSPSGKVTAKLVYANYGTPEDFEELKKMGVSVKGKIVMMRYGECFRGLKIMNAENRGAIGAIIYSDPMEDGFSRGRTYPNGPWRPPSGVQRGSVQHISKCSGDPWRLYLQNQTSQTTPSSVKDLCGYETEDMIPKHVAVPISYEDAQPLLEKIGGSKPSSKANFQGGLPFDYTVGPSDFDVTIETNHTFFPKHIPNVIARLRADQQNTDDDSETTPAIMLGNHRDAWVFGAVDPNSGTTALLEVARTFQVLKQTGKWKQKRDIILASWSGEEYGLLGSTAYAELNAQENDQRLIAYLNVDCAVTGNVTLEVSATHSLNTLFREAAEKVPAPPPPLSTKEERRMRHDTKMAANRSMADVTVWTSQKVATLGSGSDYTAYLDRYGISSLDMSYRGNYGVYHSVYDSFSWMELEGDPTFEIHRAMTRLWALMAFRLATSEIVPVYMTPQATQLRQDVDDVTKSIEAKFGGQLNMAALHQAASLFYDAATAIDLERSLYEKKMKTVYDDDDDNYGSSFLIKDINRRLSFVERQFLGPGLPKRPWYRHLLQAPAFFLGYGTQAFPGIAQAILDGDEEMAKSEIMAASTAVTNAATYLKKTDATISKSVAEEQ